MEQGLVTVQNDSTAPRPGIPAEMLVGAGTVLTVAQVDAAVAAGAEYIVTPGLNPKVL